MKKMLKSLLTDYLIISLGSAIYAVAISLFLDPNGIIPGGFTGLAMIVGLFIPGVKTGTIVFFLNIPIIVVGIVVFGVKFLSSTIYSVVLSSLIMNLLAPLGPLTRDPLLCCVAGGCLMAIGLEMVLMRGATTGGTDIIVKLLRKKIRSVSAGTLFIATDGLVILFAAIASGNIDSGLYAALCTIISSVVMDYILNGRSEAKMLLVVSDSFEEIASRLMVELDAGVTLLEGMGGYSGAQKRVLLCVVKKQSVSKALRIIKQLDDRSFAIITTADEVFGEGYKHHGAESF